VAKTLAAPKIFLHVSVTARTQIKKIISISDFPFLFRLFG